jgi:hypothetical protein
MSTQDTGFVLEVQHHKDAYVSIEVSTKDRVPLDPKPLQMTTNDNPILHYQSPHIGGQYKLL